MDDPTGRAVAKQKAAQIELDIQAGYFDPTLLKYKPQTRGNNLIDSTKSALLPAVGDHRGFAVQSRHRWIFAYDNLTHLTTEQQDAMCCASTGAGYTKSLSKDYTFTNRDRRLKPRIGFRYL